MSVCAHFQSSLSSIIKDCISGRVTEDNKIGAGMMQKVGVDNKQTDSYFAKDSSVC